MAPDCCWVLTGGIPTPQSCRLPDQTAALSSTGAYPGRKEGGTAAEAAPGQDTRCAAACFGTSVDDPGVRRRRGRSSFQAAADAEAQLRRHAEECLDQSASDEQRARCQVPRARQAASERGCAFDTKDRGG